MVQKVQVALALLLLHCVASGCAFVHQQLRPQTRFIPQSFLPRGLALSSSQSDVDVEGTSTVSSTDSTRSVVIEDDPTISKPIDKDYPNVFTGRLWFSPSITKISSHGALPPPDSDVTLLNLFGYSLGGSVALEYDSSPVGQYREYVTMTGLAYKRGSIGQWGSRLYVSTQEAEDVCKEIWGVPAEVANISFSEARVELDTYGKECTLQVTAPPNPFAQTERKQSIEVEGWENTRVLTPQELNVGKQGPERVGNVPVFWTPTIKALWAPWVLFSSALTKSALPLHKLRLSASAIRLKWTGFSPRSSLKNEIPPSDLKTLGIPLGFGLIVDNVLIEIGTEFDRL